MRTKSEASNTVLLVCNSMWAMFNFRSDLIRRLAAEGVDVVVAAPADRVYSERLEGLGVRTFALDLPSSVGWPHDEVRRLIATLCAVHTLQPRLVLLYTAKPIVYGALACSILNVRSVAVVTGQGYAFMSQTLLARLSRMLWRLGLRLADRCWFVSRSDRGEFIAAGMVDETRSSVMPAGEGIDTEHFNAEPINGSAEFDFVMLARLVREKGVEEYCGALARLRAEGVNVRAALVGPIYEQSPSALSSTEIISLCKGSGVDYLGPMDDVREIIRRSRAIVLPSYHEGWGRTLVEAGAMRRPVIATRVPGCVEVVEDGVTGFLCEARSAADLAGVMATLLSLSDGRLREMGESGRRRVIERYSNECCWNWYCEQGLLSCLDSTPNRDCLA